MSSDILIVIFLHVNMLLEGIIVVETILLMVKVQQNTES